MTIFVRLLPASPLLLPSGSLSFDKLGHENKPPQCQENAKYRASFLWQCLFNQLPLISAFSECNGGEICTPPTSSPLNTPLHLFICLLLRFLVSSSILVILLATLLILCHAVSVSVSFTHSFLVLSLSPLSYLPLASLTFFFFASHPHLPSSFVFFCILILYFFLFYVSLLFYAALQHCPVAIRYLQCALKHRQHG